MITYHYARAGDSVRIYSELLDEFDQTHRNARARMDRWTASQHFILTQLHNTAASSIVEIPRKTLGVEGDERSIIIRNHLLPAIKATRLAIQYMQRTDAEILAAMAAETARA